MSTAPCKHSGATTSCGYAAVTPTPSGTPSRAVAPTSHSSNYSARTRSRTAATAQASASWRQPSRARGRRQSCLAQERLRRRPDLGGSRRARLLPRAPCAVAGAPREQPLRPDRRHLREPGSCVRGVAGWRGHRRRWRRHLAVHMTMGGWGGRGRRGGRGGQKRLRRLRVLTPTVTYSTPCRSRVSIKAAQVVGLAVRR